MMGPSICYMYVLSDVKFIRRCRRDKLICVEETKPGKQIEKSVIVLSYDAGTVKSGIQFIRITKAT